MIGYKVLTRSYRSPIQGGPPLFDGRTPFVTPSVVCSDGPEECGVGWNFCRDPQTALRIGRCWPDGHTSTLWVVEAPEASVVQRKDKCRAPQLTIVRATTDAENRAAVLAFCALFGLHERAMATAMDGWARLLAGQPGVKPPARLAWAAWDARDARDAWTAWDALAIRYARLVGWAPGDPAEFDVVYDPEAK